MYPRIADLGPVTIHTYGVLLALAFIAGIWLASRNAKKVGINPDLIWNMGLIIIFSALVGAKLLLFISDFTYYFQNPREIFSLSTLRYTGVYYGGLLFALAASVWYTRKTKLAAWTVADISAPGIAIGQAIGRLGCLASGCCFGKTTQMPWGITFSDEYAYNNVGVPLNIPLHPTQIYESLGTFLLFLFLMWRLSRKRFHGQIILEYLLLYAPLRFVIEFFRNDNRGFVLHGLLSTSQFIGILTFLIAIAVYYYLRHHSKEVQHT